MSKELGLLNFICILVTLVFQGLTLPWVIKLIKPDDRYETISEARQEVIIQKKTALAALNYLDEKQSKTAPNESVEMNAVTPGSVPR